jgi:hypothetical protein
MATQGEDLNPGACSLLDQYEYSVPGRLPNTKGEEKAKFKNVGGTLAVNHGSTVILA